MNGNNLWVSISEMNGNVITNTKEKITDLAVKKSNVKLVKEGTTLLSFKLSIGKTAIAGNDLYTNEAIAALEVLDCNIILNQYIFSIFNARYIDLSKDTYNAFGKSLNSAILNEIKIPLPPIEIQEKIIQDINSIQEKEALKKARIEQLKNEAMLMINNVSANLIKLKVITTKIGSGATPLGGNSSYQNSGISLIRSQNIYDYGFVEKGLAFINEEQAKKLDNVTVKSNDILFNITGASIARCCIVEDKYLPARVNQHVSIIRTNEIALPKYVQMVLVSQEYKNQLLQIGEGATSRQAITKQHLEEFKIPLPSIEEQKIIVAKANKLEKEISILENDLAGLDGEKEKIIKKYLEH